LVAVIGRYRAILHAAANAPISNAKVDMARAHAGNKDQRREIVA